jgi:hypothetical protein
VTPLKRTASGSSNSSSTTNPKDHESCSSQRPRGGGASQQAPSPVSRRDHHHQEAPGENAEADLKGKRYGRLLVVRRAPKRKGNNGTRFVVECDCGTRKTVFGFALLSGSTRSCGCSRFKSLRDGEQPEAADEQPAAPKKQGHYSPEGYAAIVANAARARAMKSRKRFLAKAKRVGTIAACVAAPAVAAAWWLIF